MILLATLNAKFIHSSLALHSIKAFVGDYEKDIAIREFTINQQTDQIVAEIFECRPKWLCFSCYIWNIEQTKQIISIVRKVLPHTTIMLGGPEVSFSFESLLADRYADIIVHGEGEKTFSELLECFFNSKPLSEVNGISYWEDGKIVQQQPQPLIALDDIPFVYRSLSDFDNRILYYESSRGCPFRCAYCLSSVERSVRFLSLERVFSDLQFFLSNRVRQIKFVDRTFNCDPERTMKIWAYLIEHDNGFTNFHFEISAELLQRGMFPLLATARAGLFQFEIGVQSTNEETLQSIQRSCRLEVLFDAVRNVHALQNIHIHLDLIAGLPLEDFSSFAQSFNDVYQLAPQQFQLGFLKLLKGSPLRAKADEYGMVYQDIAPYTILFNQYLSFEEMLLLQQIEETVETFYNSQKFFHTLRFCVAKFPSPFDFYQKLSLYLKERAFFSVQHNKMELYTVFFTFSEQHLSEYLDIIKEMLTFDIYLHDNVKTLPYWLTSETLPTKHFYQNPEKIQTYLEGLSEFTAKQIARMCHIEPFRFNIIKWIASDFRDLPVEQTRILFNYKEKDSNQRLGLGHATFCEVTLS